MIRLAHLSDIHFGGENVAATEGAVAYLADQVLDAVIVSGDLTRFGEKPEFESARAWLDRLPKPQVVVPGNHDAPYLAFIERFFAPFARYRAAIGATDDLTFQAPDLAIYGFNSARGVQPRANWSKGQVSRRQTDAACSWIAAVPPGALRIAVCHHPLTEMIGGPMTGRVWRGERAAQRLAVAGAHLVLTGHIHAPFAWTYPWGEGRTHAVGAGTLSVRERGVPPGFNLLEAEGEEIRVTALAWEGHAFAPFRTWSLPWRR